MFYLCCLIISPNNFKQKSQTNTLFAAYYERIPILCQQHSLIVIMVLCCRLKIRNDIPINQFRPDCISITWFIIKLKYIFYPKETLHPKRSVFFLPKILLQFSSFSANPKSSVKRMLNVYFAKPSPQTKAYQNA